MKNQKPLLTIAQYLAAAVSAVLSLGALGLVCSAREIWREEGTNSQGQSAASFGSVRPHDPSKPTVVVAIGTVTEVTDALVPYALFAESGLYNVYLAAVDRQPKALSGGLVVDPHYSLSELDSLLPDGPSVAVVPYVRDIEQPRNKPLVDWVQRLHGNHSTLLFSWCIGANILAEAGVLDGSEATTHWMVVGEFSKRYPKVDWKRGQRFIRSGRHLTAAGLLSGIDATLYLLADLHGPDIAERVAGSIGYQDLRYCTEPRMEQLEFGSRDLISVLNMAYYWPKNRVGVHLATGADEIAISAAFDVFGASFTDRTTPHIEGSMVITKNGIRIRRRSQQLPLDSFETVLVPSSTELSADTAADQEFVEIVGGGEHGFVFENAIGVFNRRRNRATAEFTAKRLEFRGKIRGVPITNGYVYPVVVLSLGAFVGMSCFWAARLGFRQFRSRPAEPRMCNSSNGDPSSFAGAGQ